MTKRKLDDMYNSEFEAMTVQELLTILKKKNKSLEELEHYYQLLKEMKDSDYGS